MGASILLCTALFFVGFYQFDRQFDKQYRTTMISIAKTARDSLNADLFPKYLETSLPDGSWYAVHDILQRLVNDFDLNLMYVSYVEPPDYSKIHYIYNPVRKANLFLLRHLALAPSQKLIICAAVSFHDSLCPDAVICDDEPSLVTFDISF